jgi:lactate dehydrogenase-like 2-hydroxyacid dehydrogenase
MKPRVLITRAVFPEVVAHLEGAVELEVVDGDDTLPRDGLMARLADKHGVLTMLTERYDAEVLAAAPQLKVVANVAVGYNNIDLAACSAAGVMATNTPGVLDDTTADLAFALLMASARRLTSADRGVRGGRWLGWRLHDPWLGKDIHHATLGIVGFGRIGQALARRARGFEMKLLCHRRTPLTADEEAAAQVRWRPLDALLAESDFVVLLVPYSPVTHHLIGERELALMKPDAHLVNVARGGVVDDCALVAALREGRIGGAGLDVFEGEPALHPGFLDLDNVVLTPHIGSSTRATRLAMAMCAADNLLAALRGERPPNLLNPEVCA